MTRIFATLAALAFAALPAPAHAQQKDTPMTANQDAAWLNRQSAALAALKAEDGWSWLEGGVMWRRTKGDGSGAHPELRDTVTVHYAGTLTDGTTFDSSFERGQPATFPLGRLIAAWQVAIPMAGVGDTIEIAAPSDMAYGPYGAGPIPGGATLFFTIELIDVIGK